MAAMWLVLKTLPYSHGQMDSYNARHTLDQYICLSASSVVCFSSVLQLWASVVGFSCVIRFVSVVREASADLLTYYESLVILYDLSLNFTY